MLLIADSGSTKTDWVLADRGKNYHYKTVGFNPYFINSESIYRSLSEKLSDEFDPGSVKEVYFYGAGCSTPDNVEIVNRALTKFFSGSQIVVEHDMLAAARALLGEKRGFAAILGTGSNTCIYDGKKIETNIDSLGYLLGDEGSGSYIGRKIVRDYLRGYFPPELQDKFHEKFTYSGSEIFNTLYNKPQPNRFLASFCEFANENKHHEHIYYIVKTSFTDFFRNLVIKYPNAMDYEFNCVGGVAECFRETLIEVASMFNMNVGTILGSPIERLVAFHTERKF